MAGQRGDAGYVITVVVGQEDQARRDAVAACGFDERLDRGSGVDHHRTTARLVEDEVAVGA